MTLWVAVFLFAALPAAQLSARAGGVVFWALALTGLVGWITREGRSALPGPIRRSLWWVALPLLVLIGQVILLQLPARTISWLPLIGLPLIALAVARSRADPRAFEAGAMLACVIGLGVVLVSRHVYGQPRVELWINRQLYGLFTAIAWLIVAWQWRQPAGQAWRWARVGALVSGACALLMFGYRGALPVMALGVIALLRARSTAGRSRPIGRGALAVTGVILGAVLLTSVGRLEMVDRVSQAHEEVEQYAQGRVGFSSIGSRLAMWKSAGRMFAEHPIAGIGAQQFGVELSRQQSRGEYPADARIYAHAHNSFLTIASEFGLIGLAAFAVALWQLIRAILRLPASARSLVGYLLLASVLLALGNDVLAHQSSLRVIVLSLAVCIGTGLRGDPAASGDDSSGHRATAGPPA